MKLRLQGKAVESRGTCPFEPTLSHASLMVGEFSHHAMRSELRSFPLSHSYLVLITPIRCFEYILDLVSPLKPWMESQLKKSTGESYILPPPPKSDCLHSSFPPTTCNWLSLYSLSFSSSFREEHGKLPYLRPSISLTQADSLLSGVSNMIFHITFRSQHQHQEDHRTRL